MIKKDMIIQEGMGVNYEIMVASKVICNDIIEKVWGLYKEYKPLEIKAQEIAEDEEEDDWYDEDDENPWYEIDENYYVECGNKEYEYNLFYEDNVKFEKGRTDGESIEINMYPLKKCLDNYYEEGMLDEPQAKHMIWSHLNSLLHSVVMHELTHTLDQALSPAQGTWLMKFPNRFVSEEDIRDCLYTFSDNEMNARIGSVGAIMQNTIDELLYFGDIEDLERLAYSGKEFKNVIDETVFGDEDYRKELRIDIMSLYLNSMGDYNNFQFKKRPDYLKYRNGNPMSFTYYLYANDRRLRKNRRLKELFGKDFDLGEKAVYNFYNRLYREYIQRIYKACYSVLINFIEKEKAKS